ncbi:MAG: hypothetical protein H0X29_00400 [Parachlamydiaceae bacterium]|nr:hypothetical protein [Parachlamydiaceae bacterium]
MNSSALCHTKLFEIGETRLFETIEYLFYKANVCTKKQIEQLTNTIARGFFERTGLEPEGRKKFCNWMWKQIETKNPIKASEMITHLFYRSMQVKEPIESDLHVILLKTTIPCFREFAKLGYSYVDLDSGEENAINKWYAGFVESYLNREEIIENEEIFKLWRLVIKEYK